MKTKKKSLPFHLPQAPLLFKKAGDPQLSKTTGQSPLPTRTTSTGESSQGPPSEGHRIRGWVRNRVAASKALELYQRFAGHPPFLSDSHHRSYSVFGPCKGYDRVESSDILPTLER